MGLDCSVFNWTQHFKSAMFMVGHLKKMTLLQQEIKLKKHLFREAFTTQTVLMVEVQHAACMLIQVWMLRRAHIY